ncbi:MAG: Gfo/Idh/MocA family oxidoreductase [Candidatus Stygibacter australis]|nr:Gfo/Idh/MocA family oxidoreductase [Candidatus Stygibacter australis]
METKKLGLVGCGRISSKHFSAIAQIEGAEIISCCDIIEQRAQDAAREHGIKSVYTSYDKMLIDEKFDAILICTPSGMHPEMGIKAAEKGIHVITEKPMGISLAAADELVKACDANQVQLFVVKQNRLNPAIQLLRKAINKGRFGKIFSLNATVRWSRPQHYYDQAKWRGTWEFDGGAFMNQASHYMDLIQWLGGPVDSVMAMTATLDHNIETEDMGTGIIRFRNGMLGTVEVTMNIFPRNLEGSITVMGKKGTVKIGGIAVNKVEHWEFKDYEDDDKLIQQCDTNPTSVYGFGHQGYLKNVIDVLHGIGEPETDGREGRKSLEIILAMYESAKNGKRVPLPLKI